MTEAIFPYDKVLYDRRFMNCGQRHAVVFLARQGVPVDLLFYNAFASSDLILDQVLIAKRPKFAFECDFYSDSDLDAIGVKIHETVADRFEDLGPELESGLQREGFVLLSGDVFYFAHCPEYRTSHAPHIVVVRGRRPDGRWDVVDDNAISVLCEYSYESDVVEAFFENNVDRKLRRVERHRVVNPAQAVAKIGRRFAEAIASHRDSHRLYDVVADYIANPFDVLPAKLKALQDAFTLLSGSRSCFARYLELSDAPPPLVATARDIAERAFVLKSMMVKSQITHKVDVAKVVDLCCRIKALEQRLEAELKTLAGAETALAEGVAP